MITSLLFERPIALITICIGGEFLLLWVWSRQRTRWAARATWIGAAVSVVLPGISVSVVTPRERIIQTCRELGRAVDDGDMDALTARMAPGFSSDGWDRNDFVGRMAQTLTRARLDQVRLRHFEVELTNKKLASATFDATCNVRTTDGFVGALPSTWKLLLQNDGGHWVVSGVESIPVPPLRISRLSDWLR